MNGLLRKPSPERRSEVVWNIQNGSQCRPTASVISHNQNISPNIQDMTANLAGMQTNKYSTPMLNTALALTQKKDYLLRATTTKVANAVELTPNTKAAVTSKV